MAVSRVCADGPPRVDLRSGRATISPEELGGVARWTDGALTLDLEQSYAPVDLVDDGGRRAIFVGELYGTPTPDHRDRLLKLSADNARQTLQHFTGGFAGVVADPITQTLLLVTDPFGIRPVYYWSDGHRLAFATRLADLERVANLTPSLDSLSVYHYLNFSYVPGPTTILHGVFVLPPGSVARCRDGHIDVASYWDITYPADATASETELATILRHHVERTVLASSPPEWPRERVGCFLSGGTDSGTIAALLARRHSPLKAYSIAFAEEAYDELSYAKAFADRYDLEHHTARLTADDVLAIIPRLATEIDQPFGNPSLIGTWRCTRLARETGVALLIAGDGGDELFGGNERYASDDVYRRYQRIPLSIRRAVAAGLAYVPGQQFQLNRARNIAYRGTLPNPERFYSDDAFASRFWDTLVAPHVRDRVTRGASLELVREHYDRPIARSEIDRLLYVDLKMAIWGNDLVKVTTAGRMAGVRVRFPFLDPALAQFTGTWRSALKLRGREKRYLFKRAVADLLPEAVMRKPKHGFGVPVAEWIRTDRRVRDAVLEPVLDRSSLVGSLLTPHGLHRLVDDHLKARWDHGTWLWALMVLARWGKSRGVSSVA